MINVKFVGNLWVILLSLVIMLITLLLPWQSVLAYNNYDNPPCLWSYTPGVKKTLWIKYGNWVDTKWKTAYSLSAAAWSGATDRVGYSWSSGAQNTLNQYYSLDNRGGYVVWYCSGSTMVRFDAWVNDYYDPGELNRRRAQVGHELGHGLSLGHSVISPSLMGPNPDPSIYYTPQPDDINGIYHRFPW